MTHKTGEVKELLEEEYPDSTIRCYDDGRIALSVAGIDIDFQDRFESDTLPSEWEIETMTYRSTGFSLLFSKREKPEYGNKEIPR